MPAYSLIENEDARRAVPALDIRALGNRMPALLLLRLYFEKRSGTRKDLESFGKLPNDWKFSRKSDDF